MWKNKYYDQWWDETLLRQQYPCDVTFPQWYTAKVNFTKYESSKEKRTLLGWEEFCYQRTKVLPIARRHLRFNAKGIIWCSVMEETYHIVMLCNSPNYHALLTAYWIKHFN